MHNFEIALEELVIVSLSSSFSVYILGKNDDEILKELKNSRTLHTYIENDKLHIPHHKEKINIGK